MIEVRDLTCGYQQPVLHNISFGAESNLCILGSNGVGKSTLAKALCGLIPSQGEITIKRKKLQEYTAASRAKAITYIPPKLESFDGLITVYEFILMGRYPYKDPFTTYTKEDAALVMRLIEESSLEAEHCIGELSSGQQQLLLIAQALAQRSEIIIFDEPTANLDPKHAKDFYDALHTLPKETQKILITHDLNFAKKLAFPILFLENDEALFYKDPATFFQRDNLEACYGVAFSVDDGFIGVAYE
ncbi:MAG: ABC transporter ATP-binding protein [Campylobacterota bacterium]|nr:ABC transporter ATP-binding protein [Campylobacterota bacterium]